jgi:UPF0042 nucleotide-binding protein
LRRLHVVVVTGMSGAGRSTALRCLEDLGYFCVDNLPPLLAPQLVELVTRAGAEPPDVAHADDSALTRIGLGIDVRTGAFLDGAGSLIDGLSGHGHDVEILFLESSDEALVRRFSETRRHHPLAPGGEIVDAIQRERQRLGLLRARARQVIDTTNLTVHDLRRTLVDYIARGQGRPTMVARILSFGFKFGLPVDADLVFDLRYLPNPHFVPELRPKTGLDETVRQFVLEAEDARNLLDALADLLQPLLPRYEREGKAYLTIALGCTGGRHRSVAMAEALAQRLRSHRSLRVEHRDIGRAT